MKDLRVLLLILIANSFPLGAQVDDSVRFQSLVAEDFYNQYLMTDSAILLDVREFFEFRRRRIPDAVNLPSSGNLEMAADSLNRNLSYFFYCYSGGRSRKAARIFYDKGFRKLYNLEGGIMAWRKEGMPTERGRIKTKR